VDVAERRRRIAEAQRTQEAYRKARKTYRKLLWWPCLVQALLGRGETMRAVYEHR
jgi:hypothetical protein